YNVSAADFQTALRLLVPNATVTEKNSASGQRAGSQANPWVIGLADGMDQVLAVAASPSTIANSENVVGTRHDDVIIGNSAVGNTYIYGPRFGSDLILESDSGS